MKKILLFIGMVGFTITIQNCKVFGQNDAKVKKLNKKEVASHLPDTNSNEKWDNLKRFVIKEILPFYYDEFDTLVKKTSLEQLHRDRSILQTASYNDSVSSIKISELEEYHKAKLLLSKKYDSLKIYNAIKLLEIKNFAGTETDILISLLENYSFITHDLIILIKEINQLKNDLDIEPWIIYAKMNERIFKYLYPDDNNNINMANYPLVLDICNRILKSKRENLDNDILYLLEEI